MKRLLTTVFLLSLFLLSAISADAQFASVKIDNSNQVVLAGDKISVSGQNFVANDEIIAVEITMLDTDSRIVSNMFSRNYDLVVDGFGNLSGSLTVDKIYQSTSTLEVLVFTKNTNVRNSNRLRAEGYDFLDPSVIEALGTTNISDATTGNNDGIAQNSEVLTISGTGWGTSTLLAVVQLEFTDAAGTISNGQQSFAASTATISGGVLSGTVTTTSTYNTGTQSIKAQVVTNIFEIGYSNVLLVPDITPPKLTLAYATYLDTIQLVFDEPVSEVGNALNNITFGGTVGTSLTPGDLYPVGSQPTTTWNISLVGGGILSNRAVGDVTVAYNHTSDGDSLIDAAGNEVETTSPILVVHDSIPPAPPTLRDQTNSVSLSVSNFIGNSTYELFARVLDGAISDASLDGVVFEGSNDSTQWTALGTDTSITASGNDADFSIIWDVSVSGNRYRILRARAFDGAGANGMNNALDTDDNVTSSPVVGKIFSAFNNNFRDNYRALIISVNPGTITASTGSDRSQITIQIQNNYGIAVNNSPTNLSFKFKELTTETDAWWRFATGGSVNPDSINLIVSQGSTGGSVWYSNPAAGGPNTLELTEPAGNFVDKGGVVTANGETITVTTGTASKIWVQLPGQTFVSGTGVTGTPDDSTTRDTLVVGLFVTDNANNLVAFNESRDLEFETTAINAPDATQPSVNSTPISSSSATTISVTFVSGADSVNVHFPAAQTGVTLTVNDTTATDTLVGVTSSGVNILHGPLQDFAFVMATPQRDGLPVTGVNTLAARDEYQNPVTSFNAATNNVTVTKNTGPGTTTITGLGSADNNVLNQVGDFVNGVADLTAQGMTIDVSINGNYTLIATSSAAPARTGISNTFAVNRVVTVSNPNTPYRANMDTTGTAENFSLSATLTGGEDPGVGDDFRIRWGFNSTGIFGSYFLVRQSPDLDPGATIFTNVLTPEIKNLGAPADYMYWWVENISTNPNATILQGDPVAASPRRLILNPNLVTEGGINGGDVAQGAFTPGVNNQEMVSILFGADPTIATIKINALTFNKSGTSTGTDVSAFHLYRDGGTLGQYDSGIDILLRTYTYSGGNTISFSNLTNLLDITGDANYILVTVDVSTSADPLHTLGLVLSDQQSISLVDNVYNGPETSININSFSNLGTAGDYSLPVTLSSFQARAGYGNIQLEWTTASEENNAGFYLMRSEDPEGEFIRLNNELIEGNGNANTSHTYSYTDPEVTPDVTYYYKLYSVDYNGDVYAYNTLATGTAMMLPKSFAIYQNYPNPFNPTTRLKFDVPKQAEISIEIYNMLGQKVRTLVNNEIYQPGVYDNIIWNARDDRGNQVANGIYYMVFSARNFDFRQVRKLVFMK
jgi:hypothetical protein